MSVWLPRIHTGRVVLVGKMTAHYIYNLLDLVSADRFAKLVLFLQKRRYSAAKIAEQIVQITFAYNISNNLLSAPAICSPVALLLLGVMSVARQFTQVTCKSKITFST